MSIEAPDNAQRKGRNAPKFDPTINWGHLLIAVAMVGSIMLAWGDVKGEDRVQDSHIAAIERAQATMATAIDRLSQAATVNGAQDARIANLDHRLTGIENRLLYDGAQPKK